jgi:hypothetical protein
MCTWLKIIQIIQKSTKQFFLSNPIDVNQAIFFPHPKTLHNHKTEIKDQEMQIKEIWFEIHTRRYSEILKIECKKQEEQN